MPIESLAIHIGYMLQVNPINRPDIKEVLTGLEAIAIAMDVDLKGKVVSYKVNPVLIHGMQIWWATWLMPRMS